MGQSAVLMLKVQNCTPIRSPSDICVHDKLNWGDSNFLGVNLLPLLGQPIGFPPDSGTWFM